MANKTKTYQLVGGWVRVLYGPGVVKLDGAGPNAGFSMEVDKSGPDEVRVEFESDDHESEIRVRWKDGGLREEIEEDD